MIIESSINNLAPGCKLAEDVKDADGRMLIAAGKILDEKLIVILKKRLLADATVKLMQPLTDEEREAGRARIITDTEYKFRKHRDNSLMQEFRKIIVDYRTRDI